MSFDITPDERAFRAACAEVSFRSQLQRRWCIPQLAWPFVYIRVRARSIPGAPDWYWVRLNCENYPQAAPTGTFWDMDNDTLLSVAKRPWGVGEVAMVFRVDWPQPVHGGPGTAFYTPTDRVAITTHALNWASQYPATAWAPEKGIVHYLNEISRLLDSEDYTGPRGTGT